MWFGPKGFASVVYALLVLQSGITAADEVFHLVALTVVLSILAHSSTDILVARLFDESREARTWWDRLTATRNAAADRDVGGSGAAPGSGSPAASRNPAEPDHPAG